jgi:hypothetical protein
MMKTILTAVVLAVGVASSVVAQGDDEHSRQTLAGLRGVHVDVWGVREDAQRHGLSETQLQTDVELRLREAGIEVLSMDDLLRTAGVPVLHVTAGTMHLSDSMSGVYAYCVSVELEQGTHLARTPSVHVIGRTWNATGMFGVVGANHLEERVRRDVRDLTDQFINAYLAANPKH